MSDEKVTEPTASTPFDVRTIKYLTALMSRHDLSEIDLRVSNQRIRLRRGPKGVQVALAPSHPAPAYAPAMSPAPTSHAPPSVPSEKPAAPVGKHLLEIKSPGVGIYYASPKPGADPFIRVGSRVSPNTPVGLLEAMKMYTEIPADCSGVVVEVIVQNESSVEFGQVLFRIDPAA